MASAGTRPNELRSPEIRFPPDTSLAIMQARWFTEKAKLKELLEKTGGKVERGSLAADVETYFKTATLSKQRKPEREQQLAWWCERFGTRVRKTLEAVELQQALKALRKVDGGMPTPSTINKYRTALSNVYTVLDGKSAATPFRDIQRAKEKEGAPRDVAYEFIQVLLAKVTGRGEQAHAFLRLLAYAPVTMPQLVQMTRGDVTWKAQPDGMSTIYTAGRDKGAGTEGKTKTISPDALDAFREFDRLNLWGKNCSRSSLLKAFKRARDKAVKECRKTMPEFELTRASRMLRKDLRHSFGTFTLKTTGDLAITQALLDHKDQKTTLRYAKSAMPELLRVAGKKIADAFAAIPPYVPPPAEEKPKPVSSPRLRKKNASQPVV
jgi:integrase